MGNSIQNVGVRFNASFKGINRVKPLNTIVISKPEIALLPSIKANQALVYFTARKTVTIGELASQVDTKNLKNHIQFLTSEQCGGRLPDTEGSLEAKNYIINQFKQAGLKPFKKLTEIPYQLNVMFQIIYQEMNRNKNPKRNEVDFSKDAISVQSKGYCVENLIGLIPAKKKTDQYVILMAHYDHLGRSLDDGKIFPGADDNASGTAALLETARILGKNRFDKNILFIATSGEETKCLGSKFLVKKFAQNGLTKDKVEVINMDCLSAEGNYISVTGIGEGKNKPLVKTAANMAAKLGINCDYKTHEFHAHTDGAIFDKAGYPSISLTWAYDECFDNRETMHKQTDVEKYINYNAVKKSAQVALATLVTTANNT